MTPPVRWLQATEASELERELLRSAGGGEPPDGAEDRIWSALLLRLPPAPDGGSGGDAGGGEGLAGGASGGLGALGALKSAGIGGLAGLLVAGAATLVDPPAPRPAAHTALSTVVTTPPSAAPTADEVRAGAPPVISAPARSAPRRPPALPSTATPSGSVGALPDPGQARETQLREESRALQAVRDALRRGDGAGALATLEATRARYPASVLGQEREALTIQALARAGQRNAARSRAREFLQKFPTSPHAESLARFADP
jgi:hypothetical protein